jgi:hypothetical protein
VGMFYRVYWSIGNRWMASIGLQPKETYWFSEQGVRYSKEPYGRLEVPNIVGYFYGIIRQYWDRHGLGKKCLLVSESKAVAKAMHQHYPSVHFVSADLFSELVGKGEEDQPEWRWDVCKAPPTGLAAHRFDSIICQSLLEHVIDPTAAMYNMIALLSENGHLYVQTHSPSFGIHRYPRDYVRFNIDYFQDLPKYFESRGVYCQLMELYSNRGFIELAIKRLDTTDNACNPRTDQ